MDDLLGILEKVSNELDLDEAERDAVDLCLDEGYDALRPEQQSLVRRLANRHSVGSQGSALSRARSKRASQGRPTRPDLHHASK